MSFKEYTNSLLKAYQLHPRQAEVIKRKQEILSSIAEFHNFTPTSILYVGFNPSILVDKSKNIYVTAVTDEVIDYLKKSGVNFTLIPETNLANFKKTIDVVVALDEYFTFAVTDIDQKNKVTEICELAREYVITTCRDYKNQDFKDREFSVPALVRRDQTNLIYLEFHDHDMSDRNKWKTYLYEIQNNSAFNHLGPFDRRAMFFKQLAKFSADAGAAGFSVHKNLMYKSLIKKNYEHVISIRF